MAKATEISARVNNPSCYSIFILIIFLSLITFAQDCLTCNKNSSELRLKNNELERINLLLTKNKQVLKVATAKKASSLIMKIQNNLVLGMIKRDTIDAEIELIKIGLKNCEVCNGG